MNVRSMVVYVPSVAKILQDLLDACVLLAMKQHLMVDIVKVISD